MSEIRDQHGNAEHPTSNTERPMAERDCGRSSELSVGRWTPAGPSPCEGRLDIGRFAANMSRSEVIIPLTFKAIFLERIWGGRRLESEFHKKLPPQKRIGDSWEIVDRLEAQSVVADGPLCGKPLHELWTYHRHEIFGDVPETPRFPWLIKILDAQDKL